MAYMAIIRNAIRRSTLMASKMDRRRFLASAAVGTAAGAAASVAASAHGAKSPPLPVPDAETKSTPDGSGPKTVCCAPASTLLFACSGAADVGKIADLSARKLTKDGVGKMSCLAGVGGRVKPLMEITKAAKAILAIDGCPLHCARNTLEQAGFKDFEHLCLADIGMEKGKTPATDKAVAKVAGRGKAKLLQ
jgi:uncharacterized metal-binding protein